MTRSVKQADAGGKEPASTEKWVSSRRLGAACSSGVGVDGHVRGRNQRAVYEGGRSAYLVPAMNNMKYLKSQAEDRLCRDQERLSYLGRR